MNTNYEADTRLFGHVKFIATTQPDIDVVIRCDDTVILIIVLAYVPFYSAHVWLDVRKYSNNSR